MLSLLIINQKLFERVFGVVKLLSLWCFRAVLEPRTKNEFTTYYLKGIKNLCLLEKSRNYYLTLVNLLGYLSSNKEKQDMIIQFFGFIVFIPKITEIYLTVVLILKNSIFFHDFSICSTDILPKTKKTCLIMVISVRHPRAHHI